MIKDFLYKYFHIKEHNSSLKTEIIAGITNYFTIIYILILVPEILISAFPGAVNESGELIGNAILSNGLTANEMLIALTAAAFLAAAIGTMIMGLMINIPFVQGPTLSICTFITYTVCHNFGYSYNQALAIVFLSGILFFILSICGAEKMIHDAIPLNLKYAVTAGIGFFIAYSGLKKAHILIPGNMIGELSLFDLTDLTSKYTKDALLAIFGVVLITILLKKRVHAAIFLGKVTCMLIAFPIGLMKLSEFTTTGYSLNLSQTVLQIDFNGLIDVSNHSTIVRSLLTVIILVFSICIIDIFETMSTLIATNNYVTYSNDGFIKKRVPHMLEIDAVTTSIGSLVGSTTVSTYVESTGGIIEGGRTGMTSLVTGLMFLVSVFISPLVALIPTSATGATLVIAGVLMMNTIKLIDFQDPTEAVPAFITMILMPITGSVLIGISCGIILYIIIHICLGIFVGKNQKLNTTLCILGFLFLITLLLIPR